MTGILVFFVSFCLMAMLAQLIGPVVVTIWLYFWVLIVAAVLIVWLWEQGGI